MPAYQQLFVRIPGARAGELESLFERRGALSTSLEDALDQPLFQLEPGAEPAWEECLLSALFDAGENLDDLVAEIRDLIPSAGEIRCTSLADRQWEREWMDAWKPLRITDRLWICPSWCEPEDDAAVNLLLDPGLAFGSGTHPTTQLCLKWLASQSLQGSQVIDFGTGSGILAIAAIKLGAHRVLAVDHDPQALEATAANAGRNGIDPGRIPVLAPAELTRAPVDFLVANILAQPLLELAPTLSSLVLPGGRIYLSGLLADQVGPIVDAYGAWFDLSAPDLLEEWAGVGGCRVAADGDSGHG